MMAASENAPVLLSNTVFLLSRHATVWERLRREIAEIGSGTLTVDSARQVRYLQNILNEFEFAII